MDLILATDESTNLSGNNGKASWPEFPEENPTKIAAKKWIEAWRDDITTIGYSPLLRGEDHYELTKYAVRPTLAVPADEPGKSTIEAKNAEIVHTNNVNTEEKNHRLREMKNRLASRLRRSLRPRAGLRLDKLLKAHAAKDSSGNDIPDCFDGIAMFKDLETLVDEDSSDYDVKRYEYAKRKMEEKKCPDNCPPQVYSTRVNTFIRDVNPYLDPPLEKAKLSKFILGMLPSQLDADARSLKRASLADKSIDTPDVFTQSCQALVEDAYNPSVKSLPDINLVALFAPEAERLQIAAAATAAENGHSGKPISKADVQKLIAAAVSGKAPPTTRGTGAERGAWGSRNGLQANGKPKGNRLPEGQTCKAGTCTFDHDSKRPGEGCYRDPDFEGPLPLRTWNDPKQMMRITKDRGDNGTKFGKSVKKLIPPTGGSAEPATAPTNLADSLMDIYMIDCADEDDDDFGGYEYDHEESSSLVGNPVSSPIAPRVQESSLSVPAGDIGAGVVPPSYSPPAPPPLRAPSTPATPPPPTAPTAPAAPPPVSAPSVGPDGTGNASGTGTASATATAAAPAAAEPPLAPPTSIVEPVLASAVGRAFVAMACVLLLGLTVFAAAHGLGGTYVMMLQAATAVTTRGGLGISSSLALVTADYHNTIINANGHVLTPPSWSALLTLMACFAMSVVYIMDMAFVNAIYVACARTLRGAVSLVDAHANMARARSFAGLASLVVFLCLLTQCGGMPQATGGEVQAGSHAWLTDIARAGTELIPGRRGEHVRFLIDELAVGHMGYGSCSFVPSSDLVCLSGLENAEGCLDVGDTGAALHVRRSCTGAVPGSVRPCTVGVRTASGAVRPKLQCDFVHTVELTNGTTRGVLLEGVVIMPECAHNLVSLGRLARDNGISFTLSVAHESSFLQFSDGSRSNVVNMGVIVLPPPGKPVNAVAQGARTVKHVSPKVIHARGSHNPVRTLRDWHRCTSDVPVEWSSVLRDDPCDDCLKSGGDEVPSDRHMPVPTKPGGLMSFDVMALGVKHVHGNQTKVLGIHDHYSKLNWVKLLDSETSECICKAWREFHAYCNSKGVTICHVHTDNGTAHVAKETVAMFRDEIKCRYTTIAPYTPRSNGAMERQWRTMCLETRKCLHNMPRNYAWYALQHTVQVRNTLPLRNNVDQCPLSLFTGSKPSAAHFRVWGCTAYAKVINPITKMADRAIRGIHLGCAPNQTGYLFFDPSTRKLHVSSHVRFVEDSRPGVVVTRHGWEDTIPWFDDDFNPGAPHAPEGDLIPQPEDSVLDGISPPPVIDESLNGRMTPAPSSDRPAPATPARGGMPPVHEEVEAEAARPPVVNEEPEPEPVPEPAEPEPASRARPRRENSNPFNFRPAHVITSMLATISAALKPGGDAHGSQVLYFDTMMPEDFNGSFNIYLCSGPRRSGDFAEQIQQLSASTTVVVNVDTLHGGHSHDLSSPEVAKKLIQLAKLPRCTGVLATIPCSTWSAALFKQPGPAPLRNLTYPSGIPNEYGELPFKVTKANACAIHCIAIAEAAASHGAHFCFENPVGRDRASQFAIKGREEHASIWTLPEMVSFARRHGELVVHFDQCKVGAKTAKTTQLLCSRSIYPAIRQRFGHLVCDHAPGTHSSILGEPTSNGGYRTKPAEQFTPTMNRMLAEAFLTPKSRQVGWVESIGSAIEPFTNDQVSSVGYLAGMAAADLHAKDGEDPLLLLESIASMYSELGPDEQARGAAIMGEVASIGLSLEPESTTWRSALAAGEMQGGTWKNETFVFNACAMKVATAKQGSEDFPSFKQAMSGPDRGRWMRALEDEIANLEHIFEPVAEDSLPTWVKERGRATEVVDMMWVLKKKYNEMRELLSFKARGTIRGDMLVKMETTLNLPKSETFAPTGRHNTLKLNIAGSCARAGKSINDSRARPVRRRTFDIKAAFLNGKQPEGRVRYIRPPQGFRQFDRRGVPIVWKQVGNCYGDVSAPRIWHQTIHPVLVDTCNMCQSDADPCFYYKVYPDGSRLEIFLYVDDAWCTDNAGSLADADLKLISDKFEVTWTNDPRHFLNINIKVLSETKVQLSSESYILSMADRAMPDWRTRPKVNLPCSTNFMKHYDEAMQLRGDPTHVRTKEQCTSYGGKVGALVYTSPCVRADAAATISRLARCLSASTDDMEREADQCILYLAQTASLSVTFDGTVADADVMQSYCDSDWCIGHSCTGWCCFLAGAAFAYASKRQQSIALSTTEAEIIAASMCAVEMVHFRTLLREMGLEQGVSVLHCDNSGAVELSRDRKSCHRSRHVDRRYFKVRELAFEGVLRVVHVATKLNVADLLTKPLDLAAFVTHRATILQSE